MRSYCTAQGTRSNLLGQTMMGDNVRKGMCIYNDWVTLPYSRKWHNIVNQLYFDFFFKKKGKIFISARFTYLEHEAKSPAVVLRLLSNF